MARYRTQFGESLVEKWGNVVKNTAFLSGLVSSNFKTESDLIEEIVKQALEKLNCLYPSDSPCDGGLVGIDSRVEKVMSLLCGPDDVCIVGIWGEGGIGKTTLAQAAFDRVCSQFDCQCFVANVREKFEKFTADAILQDVVSKLFGTSSSNMARKRLSRKRAILVLDDVSDLDQIKSIIRYMGDFGCGSRIIVTSSDIHLLKNLGAKTFEVQKLDDDEALRLFSLNAFNKKFPLEGYVELSKRAVKYAQGLPLALEVLGCNLFWRSAPEWEDELEKLKGTPDPKIFKILRISYDGLSDLEKEIFLDIACFPKLRWRDEVESLLDVRGSKIGISRLAEKALISISSNNLIQMHDVIQQMAKDIICEQKTVEKRRWLWDIDEIYFLLTREMGTEAVRGISLDMSKIRNISLSPTAFLKLYNLRYLNFYVLGHNHARLSVPRGLEYLPEQLRYLRWVQYPSNSLPLTSFCIEKLKELDMRDSRLEELGSGVQNLPNLKMMDLSGSAKLTGIPDLSTASNLEFLYLIGCESLVEIPSLRYLNKLTFLNLRYCSRLEILPNDICSLRSLSFFDVSYCENLHGLPQNFGNLRSLCELKAKGCGIKELPESFCNLKKLRKIKINECSSLHTLPQNFGNLKSLEELLAAFSSINELPDSICSLKACKKLDFYGCVYLHGLPENIGNLESVQFLQVGLSGIREVPFSINNLRELTVLSFSWSVDPRLPPLTGNFPHFWCIDLTDCGISGFPTSLCSVTSLQVLHLPGNNFESIPESIQNLSKLEELNLRDCKKLKYLPGSIQHLLMLHILDLDNCKKLKAVPEGIKLLPRLKFLSSKPL